MMQDKLFQAMRIIEAMFSREYLIRCIENYFSDNPEIVVRIESLDIKSVEAEGRVQLGQ